MAIIEIKNLHKKFGNKVVTRDVNLSIPKNEFTVIIGLSGEGKSVLLKQIIGLLEPTSGSITIDGINIQTASRDDRAQIYKKVGYVFQFAALLDSLTVFENIGIALLENGIPYHEVKIAVEERLRMVNLDTSLLNKYPSELSGGQKKRVGLARTLICNNPEIILYDEPTTGLDPITRRVIHQLILATQKNLNLTSVAISHDLEIFEYADNVAMLYGGEIVYFGKAHDIWDSENPYIYQFVRGKTEGPIQSEIVHEYGEI